jgi:hypothetical protein
MKIFVLVAALGLGFAASGPVLGAASTTSPKLDKAALEARAQECAREADVRGLKGNERRHFKQKCKNGKL